MTVVIFYWNKFCTILVLYLETVQLINHSNVQNEKQYNFPYTLQNCLPQNGCVVYLWTSFSFFLSVFFSFPSFIHFFFYILLNLLCHHFFLHHVSLLYECKVFVFLFIVHSLCELSIQEHAANHPSIDLWGHCRHLPSPKVTEHSQEHKDVNTK